MLYSAAVYELLKKKSRLFSFGGNNAFLEFFLEGVPGITQTHVDSKKVRVLIRHKYTKICPHMCIVYYLFVCIWMIKAFTST